MIGWLRSIRVDGNCELQSAHWGRTPSTKASLDAKPSMLTSVGTCEYIWCGGNLRQFRVEWANNSGSQDCRF